MSKPVSFYIYKIIDSFIDGIDKNTRFLLKDNFGNLPEFVDVPDLSEKSFSQVAQKISNMLHVIRRQDQDEFKDISEKFIRKNLKFIYNTEWLSDGQIQFNSLYEYYNVDCPRLLGPLSEEEIRFFHYALWRGCPKIQR